MKRFLMRAVVAGMALGCVAALTEGPVVADDGSQAVIQVDRAFEQALAKSDKAAVGALLDADFGWTDWTGNTNSKGRVLENFDSGKAPKSAIAVGSDGTREYTYGQVGVVEVDAGKMHVLRIWVQRSEGWRALVYQEVKSLDGPATVTPGPGKVCENPCKSVPYLPKNAAEKAVIASYTGLESSAMAHNASEWSIFTAEEFKAASSNSDRLLDKPTRLTALEHEKMGGLSPTPLVSARMFDFSGAVVMISLHRPDRGKPLHVTRVWIERGGKWVSTLSYQTSIQNADAVTSK